MLLFSFAPPSIWLQIIVLIISIVVVLWGADRLTEGSSSIALRMGIPQLIVGLTIVAMGTSMPELCVSLLSALKGTSDLAVGNVVGSNIFNALLIVGCAAVVSPIAITGRTVRRDIPFALVASIVLFMLCVDGNVSRLEALLLLAMFIFFMVVTVRGAKTEAPAAADDEPAAEPMKPLKAWIMVLIGLLCLILGSSIFVDNATAIAKSLNVSDAIIGLTIVAGGTSLPELATSIVAARKGNSGIAIGNVVGSNVFNILMILGLTGVITPMQLQGITTLDLSVMTFAMIALWAFSYTKLRIARWEGAVLIVCYIIYTGYLIHGVL